MLVNTYYVQRANCITSLYNTGIGYAIVVVLMLVNTYYNVLIAYALFYLFASITDELPWSRCDNKWNTEYCIIERCCKYVVKLCVRETGQR